MPSISVALATYNGERFLQQQLDSLARQTRLPDELVVVDDGSEDASVAILERFAAEALFPVRIYSNEERLGWRGNFMRAADLCQSELISFCDQDDIWYESKLEVMIRLLRDPNTLLGYHNAELIDADGRVFGELRCKEKDVPLLLPRSRPTIWSTPFGLTITFRRELLRFHSYWRQTADPRDTTMPAAHDQWFFYLASNLGNVRYTRERLLGYRQHGGNTVGFAIGRRAGRRGLGWDASQNGYIVMLEKFCRFLEQAHSDHVAGFGAALADALRVNAALLQHLRQIRAVHCDPRFVRRLANLVALMRQRAFSRQTQWNLGRRALVSAALVGLPAGR